MSYLEQIIFKLFKDLNLLMGIGIGDCGLGLRIGD